MGQFWYIFLWLLIAHLIADFPLQTNRVFAARYKYKYGGIIHVVIHFIIGLILLVPYLGSWKFCLLYTIITVAHYFIDTIKKKNIWAFFGDQLLHIILLGGGAFLCRGDIPFQIPQWLGSYYYNIPLLVYIIGYLLVAYVGIIVVLFLKRGERATTPPSLYEKTTGGLARVWTLSVIILAFNLHWGFVVLAPAGEIVRFVVVNAKRELPHLSYKNVMPRDIVISFIYSILVAIPFCAFFPLPVLPHLTI
ncbi:MAG: DUF3307 domain-containing protein [bacterium]|nr:DUF3307 domain-containing protein [bacterium]